MDMAYRIVYGGKKKLPKKNGKGRIIVVAALLGLALVGRHFGWGQYLIPGDAAVTAAAAKDMVAGIAAGEPVREVFADFCREIIGNGEIY